MSRFLECIGKLIASGRVRISEHGYDELAFDGLTVKEIVNGILEARAIEEYPNFPKGPCVLCLQKSQSGEPVHVVWGIPKGHESPAVLVTAYRPNPELWDNTFTRRHKP